MEIKPLQQGTEKDCSLLACINCYILNGGIDSNKFTQELVNKLMIEYTMKFPRDAFLWLKEKGYALRYMPASYKDAKNHLNKWRAIICRRKYNKNYWIDISDDFEANGSKPIDIDVARGGHFFVIKKDWDVIRAWDSNTLMVYKINLDYFHREGVIGSNFYYIH